MQNIPRRLDCLALFAALVAVGFGAVAGRAENWPNWRGPGHDGVSGEKNAPVEWGDAKNVAWTLPLPGMGGSTPVVWNDRIFLTCADAADDLVLLCVGTGGKVLWERKLGHVTRDVVRREGGVQANEASASPTTDGARVYALVGSGDLACFDFEGNAVWRLNIQERYGKYNIYHGIHTSPLLDGDRLYLALLHSDGHWVVALDKKTGNEVWKLARKTDAKRESREAYTSPLIWESAAGRHLIVHGADYTTAHNLEDGGEVWRLELNDRAQYLAAFRMIATPVCTPDVLIVSTTKNFSQGPGGPIIALKPGARGALPPASPFELWRIPTGAPDIASPLLYDGLLYLCRENGILACVDGKTGKELYHERVAVGHYRASPVAAAGKVYLTAYEGSVVVVRAGPKFEVLATNPLPDTFTASPAVANGRIYLRGFKALYAIEAAVN